MAERIPPQQISPEIGVGYPGVPSATDVNVKPDAEGLVARPELEIFTLAMIGGRELLIRLVSTCFKRSLPPSRYQFS